MYARYRFVFKQTKDSMVKLVDTHCHIYSEKFREDLASVMEASSLQGVQRIYMPNIDIESIDAMMECKNQYPTVCFPMMGLHPCSVDSNWEETLATMKAFFPLHTFYGVGETGIDLYWDKSTLEMQKAALRVQVQWAIDLQLPLILHTRSAVKETVEVLREFNGAALRGIFHCFSEGYEYADEIASMGFYFGIGGVVTYKNSGLSDIVSALPKDRILLETDAPYLAPVPQRGKRNEPAFVWHVAHKLSEILGMSIADVGEFTAGNAKRLFHPAGDLYS